MTPQGALLETLPEARRDRGEPTASSTPRRKRIVLLQTQAEAAGACDRTGISSVRRGAPTALAGGCAPGGCAPVVVPSANTVASAAAASTATALRESTRFTASRNPRAYGR